MTHRSKRGVQQQETTMWYDKDHHGMEDEEFEDEFYDERDLKKFESNLRVPGKGSNKNSRQSLETDEESSSDPGDLEETFQPHPQE